MSYYKKGDSKGFYGKGGLGSKIIGGAKFTAGLLDNPIAESIVGVLSPELGVGLHAVRASGLLERLKK